MTFTKLLDDWGNNEAPQKTREAWSIHLSVEDAAKIEALADLFPGIDTERVISDLLSSALDELEACMPYVPGDTVIREDEQGDPVFEDVGLSPKFRELLRKRLEDA